MGAVGIVWAIGGYAVVLGVLLISLGLRLRPLRNRLEEPPAAWACRGRAVGR